ncbi:MAG: zinc-binding dehydrogenase [Acidobacteria bacterium]|nr:zinc-binding dehydrogenase [Acidobacteriota bacterium]
MIAVQLEGGRVALRKRARPRRPPGFALIRPRLMGICNTDLELRRGYYGFSGTPGHEFVGEVVEADTPALIGKRVVGEINLACNACDWCRRGLGRHCPRRTVLGIVRHPGAMAELLTLPEVNLREVPKALPDEAAVFTEPLAAACEILDQTRIPRGAEVAVLGDGKLGLLVAQTLLAHGVGVFHAGRHAAKLAISKRAGAEVVAHARKLPRARFDWVVDATGSAAGLREAVSMTRPRGTLILKSTVHGAVELDTAPVIVHEITLVGSRCGRFEPALRLLRTGRVDVGALVSDRLPLEEAPRAFDRAAERGVLKVLLENGPR